ncbi:MAG: FecR family protein [Cellvibrio sp.]|uniref:FecR domain-containing protein n=1 Tax=Cellvibrio sp. TaxID=1965322 RepID=UPI0031B43EB4
MKASIPLARPVLEAAADWHVRLKFDTDDDLETTAQLAEEHAQWLAANEQHRRAWALVERMDQQLCQLPQEASLSALNTNRPTQLHRRTVLGGLILLAGGASFGWSTYEQSLWHSWVADYRTAAGQHQVIQLADGGRVDLNTASALDVHYDANLRLLRLYQGEMLIQTAPDNLPTPRPLVVDTPQGRIRALGTRFSVRIDGDSTHIAVYEHAVEISPQSSGLPLILESGQSARFTRTGIILGAPADDSQLAWTRGLLVAIDQRLDDFLTELSRYHGGRIDCDPAVAGLRVTGVYRTGDINHVLESIALSHPVRINRFAGVWTRVVARD